jgi:TolB protein
VKEVRYEQAVAVSEESIAVRADCNFVTRLFAVSELVTRRPNLLHQHSGWRGEIYVMNADGSGVSRLTTTGAKSPVSSPDGSKVAFISMSLEHQSPVVVADPDGGNVRTVAKDPLSAFWPCWSADGASIAAAVDSLGVSNIFQIDLKDGNRRRLTAGPKIDTQPAISPDGAKLAFQSNRSGNYEIYIMNLR